MTVLAYDRETLVEVLVYHQRFDSNEKACGCGWQKLGASHAEHVADVYEQSMGCRSSKPTEGDDRG